MDAAIYETDFYSDVFIKDPHVHYKDMRDTGPVVWLSQNNCYAVTRYAEVVEVLRGADRFQSGRGLHLARRELIHLITAMLKNVRRWNLDGEPQIAMNNTIRAFSHLPVRIET